MSLIAPTVLLFLLGVIEGIHFVTRDANRLQMYDEEIGWSNFPSRVTVQKNITYTTNSDGLRSKEVDPKKEKILILGDSVIYGFGIQDNETATYYLDKEFPEHQVLNLGVGGYGIDQYYLRLKRFISKFKPKLIGVVICTGNDIRNTQSNVSYGHSKPLFIKFEGGKFETAEKRISRFTCPNIFSTSWLLQKSPFASLRDKYCSNEVLSLDSVEKLIMMVFSEMNKLAESNNSKLFFILWPSQSNFDDKKSIVKVLEYEKKKDPKYYAKTLVNSGPFYFKTNWSRFKAWLGETNYLTLDFLEKTKEFYSLEESKKLYIDHYHMSPAGSRLLALEMKKFIEQKQLL